MTTKALQQAKEALQAYVDYAEGKETDEWFKLNNNAIRALAALATVSDASPSPVSVHPSDELAELKRENDALKDRLFKALDSDPILKIGLWEVDHAQSINRSLFSDVLDVAAAQYDRAERAEALLSTQPAQPISSDAQPVSDDAIERAAMALHKSRTSTTPDLVKWTKQLPEYQEHMRDQVRLVIVAASPAPDVRPSANDLTDAARAGFNHGMEAGKAMAEDVRLSVPVSDEQIHAAACDLYDALTADASFEMRCMDGTTNIVGVIKEAWKHCAAQPVSVPVSDETRETLMRAVEGAIARSEEIGEEEWYHADELMAVSKNAIPRADAEYIAALTPVIAFGLLSTVASVPGVSEPCPQCGLIDWRDFYTGDKKTHNICATCGERRVASPQGVSNEEMLRREIHNLKRHIEDYCQPAAPQQEPVAKQEVCPITRRPFFMNIDHPDLGSIPTYGGPFDSFSCPYLDDDGDLRVERYDHDRGEWIEGGEPLGYYLTSEQPEDHHLPYWLERYQQSVSHPQTAQEAGAVTDEQIRGIANDYGWNMEAGDLYFPDEALLDFARALLALAAASTEKEQSVIDYLTRVIERIAVGDSSSPAKDAEEALVGTGFWAAGAIPAAPTEQDATADTDAHDLRELLAAQPQEAGQALSGKYVYGPNCEQIPVEHLPKPQEAGQARELRNAALEEAAKLCDEYEEITASEKDSALLVGKIDLSNAMSGEPRAARFIAEGIRNLKSQQPAPAAPVQPQEPFRECRHCGWECRPNDAQSKRSYPVQAAPSVPDDLRKLYVELTNGDAIAEDGGIKGYLITHKQLDRFEALLAAAPAPSVSADAKDALSSAVEDHCADLDRCAEALRDYPAFAATASEITKAASEFRAAIAAQSKKEGNA